MADVLTHIDTLDVEVAGQEELDVTVGSPMEHSRVLSITKNGKHVVSEYDLANVDVKPLPKQDKVVEITKNGEYTIEADDGRQLNSVVAKVDTAEQCLIDFLNNGGTFACYKGTEMPKIDWEMVTLTDWYGFFRNAKNISLRGVNFSNVEKASFICMETTIIDTELYLDMPKLTDLSYGISYVYGNLKKLTINAPNLIESRNQFSYCTKIEEILLLNTTKMKSINYSFSKCTNLRKLSAIQCESLTEFYGVFYEKQPALEDFGGFVNIGKSVHVNLVFTLTINNAPNLTHQSLLNVLNGLYDLTALHRSQPLRLQLGEANYNKLTEDEIKIATEKGWTVIQ